MLEYRLQNAVKYVCETFFPDWDKKRKWKVIECSEELNQMGDRGTDGHCDIKTKTIKINMSGIKEDPNDLYDLLIHEICHCDIKGHGQDWQDAMLDKAEIAEKIGLRELAEWIKKDADASSVIEQYREIRLKTRIHGHVCECLRQHPGISFKELMKIMVKKYGAPAYMSGKYARAYREVYDYYKSGKARFFKYGVSSNEQT